MKIILLSILALSILSYDLPRPQPEALLKLRDLQYEAQKRTTEQERLKNRFAQLEIEKAKIDEAIEQWVKEQALANKIDLNLYQFDSEKMSWIEREKPKGN